MAEKEERIYYIETRVFSETKECEKCKANGWNCIDTCEHFKQPTENRISRQEAIEKMAKGIYDFDVVYCNEDRCNGNKCEDCAVWKRGIEIAEAALNALLSK